MAQIRIKLPVCRIVQGDIYTPQTEDANGQPLVYKTGSNAGQARSNYFFAVAIPKGAEQHWAQTAWGQQIYNHGNAEAKTATQRPDFAWKIIDGDSTVPNQNNKRPCDNENFRGHWIVRLSGGYAPKVYVMENGGFREEITPHFCKPGHFVEALISAEFNGNAQRPGMYLNHLMVCHRGYGPEIVYGPDVSEAGFGADPLPAGCSAMPVAASAPLPAMPPAPVNVQPNPAFVQQAAQYPGNGVPATVNPLNTVAAPVVAQAPAPMPPAPPAPVAPAVPAHRMTPAANGVPYEAYIAAGWTDATLIANGYMVA